VIEVAESSLAFDRRDEGSLYARAQLPEYWIVNLVERVLEVYRDPGPDPTTPYGWRYRSLATVTPPAVIVPVGVASVRIPVFELLP